MTWHFHFIWLESRDETDEFLSIQASKLCKEITWSNSKEIIHKVDEPKQNHKKSLTLQIRGKRPFDSSKKKPALLRFKHAISEFSQQEHFRLFSLVPHVFYN